MDVIVKIIGGLFAAIVIFVIWRIYLFNANTRKRDQVITDKLIPLIEVLQKEEEPSAELIKMLAEDSLTRHDTLQLLTFHKRNDLFPKSQNTPEKLAESDLVRYLLHGNEFDELITKIQFMKEVSHIAKDGSKHIYYVFKCYSEKDKEWYLGTAGHVTFSRMEKYDESKIPAEIEFIESRLSG